MGDRFILVDLDDERVPEDYRSEYFGSAVIDTQGSGFVGCDGGEPEDQFLGRDWSWVVPALNRADQDGYLRGLREARAACATQLSPSEGTRGLTEDDCLMADAAAQDCIAAIDRLIAAAEEDPRHEG